MLGEGAADDTNGIVETAEKKISINYSKFKFKFDKKVQFFLLNISQICLSKKFDYVESEIIWFIISVDYNAIYNFYKIINFWIFTNS